MDLLEVLRRSNAVRTMNLLDTLLIEESLLDARDEEARSKAKTNLNSAYDRIRSESGSNDVDGAYEREMQPRGYIPENYLIPDETGYAGLEPPMG